MSTQLVNEMVGDEAPPRSNGELVFDQPWQSAFFGLTLGLCESGHLDFEDFRQRLIARIAASQDDDPASGTWSYWTHWAGALEDVLYETDLVDQDDVDLRVRRLVDETWAHDHADGEHDHAH